MFCRLCGCLPVVLTVSVSHAADTNFTLPVSGNITSGSCEVRMFHGEGVTDTADKGAEALESDVGSADPALLVNGGVTALREDTAVTLKLLCSGAALSGAVPVITANGTATGAGAAAYLFKGDGRSDIDPRVGAVISTTKGTGLTIQPWNTADYIRPGGEIQLSPVTTGNAQNMSVTIYTGISCGDATSCDAAGGGELKTGLLYAPVTFDFVYR